MTLFWYSRSCYTLWLVGFDSTFNTLSVPSFIVDQIEGKHGLAQLCFIFDDCLQYFPDIQVPRKKQETYLVYLALGKEVSAILATGFCNGMCDQQSFTWTAVSFISLVLPRWFSCSALFFFVHPQLLRAWNRLQATCLQFK